MKKSIGFIGGGRITRIILQAFKNKNTDLGKIFIYDINPETEKLFQRIYPESELSDLNTAASCDIVFIALHPPVIMETLAKIKDIIKPDSVFISLAPKITIRNISSSLGNSNIVRLIPNATSIMNKGYNPVCFGDTIKGKQEILQLLNILGKTFETEEFKLEAYAISSAMLPTYFWFQWYELINLAGEMGLSEAEAKETIEETLRAAIDVMFKSNLNRNGVMDLIPVKPIGENENQIVEIYRSKLTGLFNKIKP
jgi:pyrroline-5-carboxylate reductase